jgi:hypothetical protein
VPAAVDAALQKMPQDDPDRIWAEISAADVLFLSDQAREQRVISAYSDAIPLSMPFAWDSARGQLDLFASLNIKTVLAGKIIDKITARFEAEQKKQEKPSDSVGKPVHLVIFAGHCIDAQDRPEPRFPAKREEKAKTLIREAVKELLDDKYEVAGLASAAPGADILAHEVCTELGIQSAICLPMPAGDYARFAFEDLDDWRTRYLDLLKGHTVYELSDKEGLPRWLHGSTVDCWERGNRWVMKMAQTWGADGITLIALWDGKMKGNAPGGTAHMVQLARDAGMVRVVTVDANKLLD